MAGLTHKKHLFFDFDDTLWDFKKNSRAVLEELYVEYALQQKLSATIEDFLIAYTKINNDLWSRYCKREISKEYLRNARFNEAFKVFGYENYEENLLVSDQYIHRAPYGSHLKNGCLETLNYLKDKYQLHIITNGFSEIFAIKMQACGIRDYFKHIIISEEHQLIKPDEKVFRLAETLAATHAGDCVMIGDSLESDIEGALNAGWDAVYLTESPLQEFTGRQISQLGELKLFF